MDIKEKIVKLLKRKKQVSGEELGKKLKLSRTAIWKQIKNLRMEGYDIQGTPKIGYTIMGTPNKPLPTEIKSEIRTKTIGKKVFYFEEVESTQDVAKNLVNAGLEEGTVVIAERQTRGRGRIGREWFSPKGGLWLSIILKPNIPTSKVQRLSLLAGVAVAKTLRKLYKLDARLKWPNDVLVEGKKICGILVEASGDVDKVSYVIIGIGVNVNVRFTGRREIANIATSILELLGKEVSIVKLTVKLLEEFEKLYLKFKQEEFSKIIDEWKNLSQTLGRKVKVESYKESFTGEALDVDDDGFLLVKADDGSIIRVVAGDIHLREA
ncbi:MAG: biotin--[acetyl-CoA-carboxylase] ligase [Candidatus Bathyarchaeota archaeon]|nr:biotin--[acetyl-CoA-carboxylase] ligase [Candidatus Bathyarchaeota archaeon]